MTDIHNPVLRGFNPDPSIVRVGADYYLATSTFEWSPLVRLHHSRNLADWTVVGHALEATGVFDLRGVPDSGGVWAPSLSHHDGRYWLVGVQWDPRPGRSPFAGISLQEYDAKAGALVGESRVILRDDELIEGPNLYFHDGYYYLMLAQGGTGFRHGITMARARSVDARSNATRSTRCSPHGTTRSGSCRRPGTASSCGRPAGTGMSRTSRPVRSRTPPAPSP